MIKSFGKIGNNRFFIVAEKLKVNENDYFSNVYRNLSQSRLIVLPRIVLSLKKGNTIEPILEKYPNILAIEETNGVKYILKCLLNRSEKVLNIIQAISNMNEIDWCEPEILLDYKTNNTLYPQQYYLKNRGQNGGTSGIDINVEPVWNITNGNTNVTVAVIDCGVDRDHEDMGNRVLEGYTIRNLNGFGVPQNMNDLNNKAHGMSCAGIIGATNNTIGVRGIASNVNILPVNIVPDFATINPQTGIINEGFGSNIEIARAINWAWKRADILSCSWGGDLPSNDITLSIDSARNFGRNGKGTIVVFASGNNNPNANDVAFPGIVDGVITVGATDNNGVIQSYSQRGLSMDLVAPSGGNPGDVVTTDRMGNLGYEEGNYNMHFNGTSAACPQVAGVAALMLSVNPFLTENQVRTTLQNTARDLGTAGFDNTYGYGLVNAYAAVSAINPLISGPSQVCDQGIFTINNLPPEATVSWSSDTPSTFKVLSGNGTDSATFYINFRLFLPTKAKVIATIVLGCQTITLTKDVQLGTATPEYSIYQLIDGVPSTTVAGITGVQYFFQIDNVPLSPENNNYHWTITPPPNIPNVDPQFTTIDTGQLISYMGRIPGTYTISMRYNGICGWSSESISTFNLSGEIINLTLSLYPNPATDMLNVSLTGQNEKSASTSLRTTNVNVEPYTIELWNERSGLVKTIDGNKSNIQISLLSLPKGMYFLHLKMKGKAVQKKPFWVQ